LARIFAPDLIKNILQYAQGTIFSARIAAVKREKILRTVVGLKKRKEKEQKRKEEECNDVFGQFPRIYAMRCAEAL